ncbi:hypothetical protein SDC9_175132 [bioreactor metagenome]|uniref:Uncharacterized protein n=1 Tax=bioreactor metagenome TaxID=1076179 RepID=A0A645GLA3_9ZZZZ
MDSQAVRVEDIEESDMWIGCKRALMDLQALLLTLLHHYIEIVDGEPEADGFSHILHLSLGVMYQFDLCLSATEKGQFGALIASHPCVHAQAYNILIKVQTCIHVTNGDGRP